MSCTRDFIQENDTENIECSINQAGQIEYFYKNEECPLEYLVEKGYNPEACTEALDRLFGSRQPQQPRGSGGFTIYVLPDAPCQKLPDGGMSCSNDVRGDFQPQGGWSDVGSSGGDKGKGPAVRFASPAGGGPSKYQGNNYDPNFKKKKNIMDATRPSPAATPSKFGGPSGNANFGSTPVGAAPVFGAPPPGAVPFGGPAPAPAAPAPVHVGGGAPTPVAAGGQPQKNLAFGQPIGTGFQIAGGGKKNKGGGQDCGVYSKPDKEAEKLPNDLSYITSYDPKGNPFIANVWQDGYWGPCGKNFINDALAKRIKKILDDKRKNNQYPYLDEKEFNEIREIIIRKRELANEFNEKKLDDLKAEHKRERDILLREQQAYVKAGGEGWRKKLYEINQEGWGAYGMRNIKEGVVAAAKAPFVYPWRLLRYITTTAWDKTTRVFWMGVEYSKDRLRDYTRPAVDYIKDTLDDVETIEELEDLLDDFDELEAKYTVYRKIIEGQTDAEVIKSFGGDYYTEEGIEKMLEEIQDDPQILESLMSITENLLKEIHNTFRALDVVSKSLNAKNKKVWDKSLEEYLEHIERLNQVKPGEGRDVIYDFPIEGPPYASPISPERFREEDEYNIFGGLDNDIDVTTQLEELNQGYNFLRRALEYEMECTPEKLETGQFLRKEELESKYKQMVKRATNIESLATYLRDKKESRKWQNRAFELLEDARVLFSEADQLYEDVRDGKVRPCKGSPEGDDFMAEKLEEANNEFVRLGDLFKLEMRGQYDPYVLGDLYKEMIEIVEEMNVMTQTLENNALFEKWNEEVKENQKVMEILLEKLKKDKKADDVARAAASNRERSIVVS